MGRRDEFRIGDPMITIAAAANFIADHAPAGTDRDTAYNSAYSDIAYARSIGKLQNTRAMDSTEFFTWAVARNGWQYLKGIQGLSYSVNVMVTGVEMTTQIGDGPSAIPLPEDVSELKALVINLTQQHEQSQRQNVRNVQELDLYRDAAAQRSAIASDNGRLGGRRKSK